MDVLKGRNSGGALPAMGLCSLSVLGGFFSSVPPLEQEQIFAGTELISRQAHSARK